MHCARLPLNLRRHEYVGKFPASMAATISELRAVVREPGESRQDSRQLQVMTKPAGRRQEARGSHRQMARPVGQNICGAVK